MKKIAILALLSVSACTVSTHSGQLEMDDKSRVSVTREVHAGSTEAYTISSNGWSCQGTTKHKGLDRLVHTIPLTCTNGLTGAADIEFASSSRATQVNTAVTVKFSISNGVRGSLRV